MNRLPRPIADWLALWRDLPRQPRQVLLNRSHSWGSTLAIGLLGVMDTFAVHPYTAEVLYTALAIAGPGSLVAIAGALAHPLWERELIWTDLECELCGDDPDDDGDDEPGFAPDDDPGGLALEVETWLKTQPTLTR